MVSLISISLLGGIASAQQLCPAAQNLPAFPWSLVTTKTGQVLYRDAFTMYFNLSPVKPYVIRLNQAFKDKGGALAALPIPMPALAYADELDLNDSAVIGMPSSKPIHFKRLGMRLPQ